VLISDLFDDLDLVLKGLRQLRYRHHEVIVWNLWDEAEMTFPFRGPTLFEGLEAAGRLLAEPALLRTRYLEEVAAFQDRLRTACGQMLVDFSIFTTSSSLAGALTGYLATRSARLRRRSSRVLGGG